MLPGASFEIFSSFYFMYMGVWSACSSMHHVCIWCLQRSEKDVNSLALEFYGCAPPCGCQELNLHLLEKQLVHLTAEPFLHHPTKG